MPTAALRTDKELRAPRIRIRIRIRITIRAASRRCAGARGRRCDGCIRLRR
ncbi:hypothetical protein ABIB15_001905 [Marisediminicola sp. UYEF4]|uniref:hypothetical protein n=1 Tax=Marisediminicola sp. UYEF4 TaxID=1756384 RepID=UPI003395B107